MNKTYSLIFSATLFFCLSLFFSGSGAADTPQFAEAFCTGFIQKSKKGRTCHVLFHLYTKTRVLPAG